jgi:hypothetical protein
MRERRPNMRKIIAALAAGSLLVGAVFTATVVSGGPAAAQEGEENTETVAPPPRRGALLESVLDDLVTQLTITEAQADAVQEAVAARIEELREEHPGAGNGFRRGVRGGFIRGLLEDGVISADELAELPDGNPLTDPDGPAASYLDDGQITEEEWQQLREELREARRAGRPATDA